MVLVMVQVVVSPVFTVIVAGVPFVQLAPVWVQPDWAVSVRL
jgi:hypothetical protein